MIFYTGIREVEVVNTAAVVAVAVVSTLVAIGPVIALIAVIYWWRKVNTM